MHRLLPHLHLLARLIVLGTAWLLLHPTAFAAPLRLDETSRVVHAWPALALLEDRSHALTVEQVLAG